MPSSLAGRLEQALSVLVPAQDILAERALDIEPPGWCEQRGWLPFLLSLSQAQVQACEADGLAKHLPALPDAPSDLRKLAEATVRAAELPSVEHSHAISADRLRSVPLRKRAQLSALLGAVEAMAAHATRVVDVGAGSGHFTRLAAELFERDSVGIERNRERVAAANRRSALEPRTGGATSFVVVDAAQGTLAFSEQDLAIGLHACGELGDRLVQAAATSRCDVALVSCCLQKRSEEVRAPLSVAASELPLRRDVLGLTNLTAQPQGVEVSIETTISGRQVRYALGRLLRARGLEIAPGAELSGINRRRAYAGLRAVAEQALALRGMPGPSSVELAWHEQEAATRYALVRRFSLPRSMLARLVEVAVSLDRGAFLEEQGLSVQVATLFARSVTPRNIGVFASLSAARLP